ncbi:hypothetical protein AMES_4390 [Amycolatopsis mediterranei S699]|uniref:Secreted protein n=2 Tax=Amycolatopsis mediterranei TaxID=33910 RepID=A0A0H3D5C9_AMYMU|nr:hypothetical protein [Amycolatopsis mediterranei]ADJ46215.1 hypothetical protein AMED_4444 [Amycolatopsis mediterranei U32]AEK43006.1 hypothetical protein RAM_22630 [Amycolatopsis mediterranei S699]AFO77926.1 hypothetical protein AMES_4390 [Amycolatopsis mediterranei S699]AGT85054.1 hypothetical protein B737_4390 [Amycolatopsis mediterranei RB]KDO05255.1 hypothetical protein DV26_39635 [Amycolatopsis mediterranei]
MKTAIQAGLVALGALLAGTTVAAAPAGAATTFQRTAVCHSGDFSGRFTLQYESVGFDFRITGGYTASGPYIGDVAGTVSLRIAYRSGSTTHTVYSQTSATTGHTTFTVPTTTTVPLTGMGTAAATFDNGAASCTATVPIS